MISIPKTPFSTFGNEKYEEYSIVNKQMIDDDGIRCIRYLTTILNGKREDNLTDLLGEEDAEFVRNLYLKDSYLDEEGKTKLFKYGIVPKEDALRILTLFEELSKKIKNT